MNICNNHHPRIIPIFSGHAKELGQSRWKRTLLGLASFWIPGFGLFFLWAQIIGEETTTLQVTAITIGILSILGASGYFCSRALKWLRQKQKSKK